MIYWQHASCSEAQTIPSYREGKDMKVELNGETAIAPDIPGDYKWYNSEWTWTVQIELRQPNKCQPSYEEHVAWIRGHRTQGYRAIISRIGTSSKAGYAFASLQDAINYVEMRVLLNSLYEDGEVGTASTD